MTNRLDFYDFSLLVFPHIQLKYLVSMVTISEWALLKYYWYDSDDQTITFHNLII